MAVEDELVLAAHQPAEGDAGEILARPLGEHPLAFEPLAGVIRRGGDVEDQRGPGHGLVAGGWTGLPQVLAHRQPDALAADVDRSAGCARAEVAALVEHAVVGKVDLAVDRVDRALREHGGRVVHGVRPLGEPDDRDQPVCVAGERVQAPRAHPSGNARAAAGPRGDSR